MLANAQLKVKLLHKDAVIPTRGTLNSAGYDLTSTVDCLLYPGERALIATGLAVDLVYKTGVIKPRSGLAVKYGIDVMAGVIDSDYRGEIKVCLINHGFEEFRVLAGDRIAQLVIFPTCFHDFLEVDLLDDTDRGEGGFGSTGK